MPWHAATHERPPLPLAFVAGGVLAELESSLEPAVQQVLALGLRTSSVCLIGDCALELRACRSSAKRWHGAASTREQAVLAVSLSAGAGTND